MLNENMNLDDAPLTALANQIPQMRDTELAAVTERIMAEIRKHVSQPSADTPIFLSTVYEALKCLAQRAPSAAVVEGFISVGHFYVLASNPVAGLAPAADAVACARLLGDQPLLIKALRLKGWLIGDSGNFPEAVSCLAEALKKAQDAGDQTAECACWNLLGIQFLQAAQCDDALTYFERSVELAADDPARRAYKDAANANIASAALEIGDLRRAFPAAQLGVSDEAEPTNAAEADAKAMREHIFARVLVELNDLARAGEHLAKAQHYAGLSGMERSRLHVATTQALLEIAGGQKDVGLTRMKQVLEAARTRSKGQLATILSDSVLAYERCGQPDVALTNLHELLENKKESAQARIVMLHRIHAAEVGAETQNQDARAATLKDQHSQLRVQMQDRELVRRNLRLLEEQAVAAELHDDTTGEHCYRVGRLASLLGKEIGLEDDILFLLDLAARLHDIGKLVVPDAILLKPGKLTPGEREIMQRHTTAGSEILGRINLPQIHIAEAIARHHHERWDGNGYPDRISGSAIPLPARVTALADVFDALTHKRPYKEAWPVHAALAEIRELSGKQFDPELCSTFLDLVPRLQREVGDLDYFLGADARQADFVQARRSIAAALKGTDPSVSLFDLRR